MLKNEKCEFTVSINMKTTPEQTIYRVTAEDGSGFYDVDNSIVFHVLDNAMEYVKHILKHYR